MHSGEHFLGCLGLIGVHWSFGFISLFLMQLRMPCFAMNKCLICGASLPRELQGLELCSKHLDMFTGEAIVDTAEAPEDWINEYEMEEE